MTSGSDIAAGSENIGSADSRKSVIVIGAGLGGLLTAAALAKEGRDVTVLEKLSLIGGRFVNFEYKGYQLSTGALHMLPHGVKGPLATMVKELGGQITVVPSSPMAMVRVPTDKTASDYSGGFEDIPSAQFKDHLSLKNKLIMGKLTAKYLAGMIPEEDIGFKSWFTQYFRDDRMERYADSFAGWSLSMTADETSVSEMFAIFRNVAKYGGPGILMGGCSSVINELVRIIKENGGRILTQKEVTSVILKEGKAAGIVCRDVRAKGYGDPETLTADLVISDIGHKETFCLYQENAEKDVQNGYLSADALRTYEEQLSKIRPSAGLKICFSCDEQLLTHGGILLTPYARRINGMDEVTNVDPTLAPEGKHLIMTHQRTAPDRLDHIDEEIQMGLDDLKDIFPGKKLEILVIQVHRDGWPVNRAFSGTDCGNLTPVKDLYIVGDGAKGKGGIEVEGIALGVTKALELIRGTAPEKEI